MFVDIYCLINKLLINKKWLFWVLGNIICLVLLWDYYFSNVRIILNKVNVNLRMKEMVNSIFYYIILFL